MKATHPVSRQVGRHWSHLNDLPDHVRRILRDEMDRTAAEDEAVIAATVAALRSARLAIQVPAMCGAIEAMHPEIPRRRVFVAVSLATGLSEPHVRNLYYRGRRKA